MQIGKREDLDRVHHEQRPFTFTLSATVGSLFMNEIRELLWRRSCADRHKRVGLTQINTGAGQSFINTEEFREYPLM